MELLTRIAPHIFLTKLVLLADASAWDGAHQLYREKVTKLPPLGAIGCVHLVSSRSCARQHFTCIAYRW
jgi:hypothetical protein